MKSKNIYSGLLLFVLFCLIILPSLLIFFKSFGVSLAGGEFTLDSYRQAFSGKQTIIALKNTLYAAVSVTFIATVFGGGMAWLVTRTDFPYKKFLNGLIFLSFTIPSYIIAVSLIQILGRNGWLSSFLKSVLNVDDYNYSVYSLGSFIFVLSIHLYPLVFFAISNALKKTDTTLENAAVMSGAGRWRVAFTITFPLITPTIISIGLFVFSRTMVDFGVASTLVLPSGNELLTTHIENALNNLDLSMAAVISVLLVVISGGIFFIHNHMIGKKSYVNITINSSKSKLLKLGRWKKTIVFVVFLIQLCITVLPLLSIMIASFLKRWGLSLSFDNLTFKNYALVLFEDDMTAKAFFNSFFYGITAATMAVVLGVSVAYIANCTKSRIGKKLEFIASLPMGIPNIVIAISVILVWINEPFKLYGSFWIIIVAYTTLFLPLIIKNVSGLLKNQDLNLENAGRMQGATRFRTFKDLMLPMISHGIEAGWVYAVLIAFREIPISLFLNSPGNDTVGVLLFSLQSDDGGIEIVSTIAVMVILITISGRLLINYVRTKNKRKVKMNSKFLLWDGKE